jgi:acyl-CoA thioester hydrolase
MKVTIAKAVYLHDTDATGAMYYGRYLEWLEEARMELLSKNYKPLTELGYGFVPQRLEIEYSKPLMLGDTAIVTCWVKSFSKFQILLGFQVDKGASVICDGEINMVCIKDGRPHRMEGELLEILSA